MSKPTAVERLIARGRAAGAEVRETANGAVIVVRRDRRNGRVLVGVSCTKFDGWCMDAGVDASVARAFRPAHAARHLGFK